MASDRWPKPVHPRDSGTEYGDAGYGEGEPYNGHPAGGQYGDRRYGDGQRSDGQYAEPPYGDRRRGDQRYAEPQYAEPQYAEPQYYEREYADQQYTDQQNSGRRYAYQQDGDGRYDGRRPIAGRRPRPIPDDVPGRLSQGGEYRRAVIRGAGGGPPAWSDRPSSASWDAGPGRASGAPGVDPRMPDPRLARPGVPDPRIGDPRAARDPRFLPGSRQADPSQADPRLADPRLADPRLADPRLADPRLADPRLADPRPRADPRRADPANWIDPRLPAPRPPYPAVHDPRPADHWVPDPWLADPRPQDPRLADPRLADPRLADPRLADPRYQTGQRLAATRPPRAIEAPRLAIEAPRVTEPPPPTRHAAEPPRHVAEPTRHVAEPTRHGEDAAPTDPRTSDPAAASRWNAEPPPATGQPRRHGENTRSVHLPLQAPPKQPPLAMPIYRTAAFTFGSSAEYASVLADATPGYSYSRIDNPTVEAFCNAVAALEGLNLSYQPATQAFASGTAAISTAFWAFTTAGARVIAPSAIYGGTYGFLRNVAANFGVQTDFVDMTDLGVVRAALRPGTAIVYAETLANPTVAVADIAGLARIAHEAGAMLVVDSTLAPPVICRPLEHGADLVVHSATKYFGGHADVTGGVVTGHPELIRKLRAVRIDTGGSLGPDDSYLLRRGLETLPLRVRRQCATALLLAAGLARHPAVRTVYYPGLTHHPGHELARRQFDAGPEGTRFGAIVTVAPYGGQEAGMMFADGLRLARLATSLGGTHTKVSHVGSTTHRQMDATALAAAGIDPGSVRFSVGLEDGEDLLADAMAALDSLGGG